MALSEEEQRLLAQLEASLAAEDPKLAQTLRGHGPRQVPGKPLIIAVLGVIAGLALLIVGMQTHPLVSVGGFVVMLAACVYGVAAWQRRDATPVERPKQRPAHTPAADHQFMDKMEERWRRRQEDGF